MRQAKKKQRSLAQRFTGPVIVLGIIIGLAYAYSQRHVYHVTIMPGESELLAIEVPMQRFGRSKSFAKERGLPMRCKITRQEVSNGVRDAVRVVVVHTEHTVHKMRAKLRVSASSQAHKSKNKWSAEFELDGQGDWPMATIVVKVRD